MFAPVIRSKTQILWDPEGEQEENLSFKTIIPGTRLERSIANTPEWSRLLLHTPGVWTANGADIPRCLQFQVSAWYWQTDTGASQARSRLTGQHWDGCAPRLPTSSTATLLCEWVPGISPNTPRVSPKLKNVFNEVAAFQGMSRGSQGQDLWAALTFWKKVTGKPTLLRFAVEPRSILQCTGAISTENNHQVSIWLPAEQNIKLYITAIYKIHTVLQLFLLSPFFWMCDGHNESYLKTMSPTACMPKVTPKSLCLNSCCHRTSWLKESLVTGTVTMPLNGSTDFPFISICNAKRNCAIKASDPEFCQRSSWENMKALLWLVSKF